MERRLDKAIKFVLVSGKKALADAGLDWQGQDIKVGGAAAVVVTEDVRDACLS
jgi:3-oxoacyl-(acyl-carrier-protein) synthase